MSLRFFLFVGVVGILILGSAVAGAQEVTPEGGDSRIQINVGGGSAEPEAAAEPIDNLTAIESAEVVDGRMVLVLRSSITQRVTLTDAGAVFVGGEIPQKTVYLREGSNRVEIPVTEVSNRVAVTIATRNVLYAKTIQTGTDLISGPYDGRDAQNAALGGGLGVAVLTGLLAIKHVHGVGQVPRRKL